MKLALTLVLALTVFAVVAVHGGGQKVQAQTPYPQCQIGNASYDPNICALLTGSYNSSNYYCQAATYNAALCSQYSGTGGVYCQPGSGYNAALCAQYSGSTVNAYCQIGSLSYNAALCAQYGSGLNVYCQVGTTAYNAALCASSATSLFCQAGTANYNAFLCNQYTQNQPAEVIVTSTQAGLSCGGTAQITVVVKTATGGQVVNGTSVSLSANTGTISPPQVSTFTGSAQAIYTPPAIGQGQITVTATSGTATGYTIMAQNCLPAIPTPIQLPTPAPAVQLPVQLPPQVFAPITLPSILPPNTGDGGLLSP